MKPRSRLFELRGETPRNVQPTEDAAGSEDGQASAAEYITFSGRGFWPEKLQPNNNRREEILDPGPIAGLPISYDARTALRNLSFPGNETMPLARIALSQGSCGSCYAFGGATAMAYRLWRASYGRWNVVPSPQAVMTCTNGCMGGGFEDVASAMRSSYIPADVSRPYVGKVNATDKDDFCWPKTPNPNASLFRNSIPYRSKSHPLQTDRESSRNILGVDAMRKEIYENGPAGMCSLPPSTSATPSVLVLVIFQVPPDFPFRFHPCPQGG